MKIGRKDRKEELLVLFVALFFAVLFYFSLELREVLEAKGMVPYYQYMTFGSIALVVIYVASAVLLNILHRRQNRWKHVVGIFMVTVLLVGITVFINLAEASRVSVALLLTACAISGYAIIYELKEFLRKGKEGRLKKISPVSSG